MDSALKAVETVFVGDKEIFKRLRDAGYRQAEHIYAEVGAKTKDGSGYTRDQIVNEL